MNLEDATVLTCSRDKNELVDCATKSLFKRLGRALPVVVMNNGSTIHSPTHHELFFNEIDNRDNRLVMDGVGEDEFPDRCRKEASDRHSLCIDYALHHFIHTRYVVLMDNDVLFHQAVLEALAGGEEFDVMGEIGFDVVRKDRMFPYFCVFDVRRMLDEGWRYFDKDCCMGSKSGDTGRSFMLEVIGRGWRYKRIALDDVIVHMKGATIRGKDHMSWLEEHRGMYE